MNSSKKKLEKIKILAIDDDIVDIEMIKRYFSCLPYVELSVSSGTPALSFCDQFDCVLIDYQLASGVSGLNFSLKLKEHNWLIPIMLYTGDNTIDETEAKMIVDDVCYKDDISDFSRKLTPFFRQVQRLKHLKEVPD